MPSAYRLRTLGSPILYSPGGQPVRFRTRKHFALLIRLAVEPGRPHTRDQLIELLWPSSPAHHGRHSLAQAVTVLRGLLGRDHVLTHRSTLAVDGAIDADVAHLDACDGDIEGRFLDGFEIPGARPFDDWKDETRARLLPLLRDCLVRQMDASRRTGDFPTVERRARVLLELDPHSEDAVRGLMEARAWVGDRSNALKVFGRYEARLRDDLGAKPSVSLVRVAHLLREGRVAARTDADSAAHDPPLRPEKPFRAEHLVGREAEFAVLYDAWLAVRRRDPRIVVITGDPGIGKTTLTNAFAATCQMEGAVVARAQAYEAERELPFGVLAELVRQLTVQRAIGPADPEALSELGRVAPEIFAAFPGVPRPAEWAAEAVPLRLANAFWRTAEAAAEESPLILVVDDIHAADTASAAVLHQVARKLAPVRLLLVLTGRPSDLRAAAAPAGLIGDPAITALRTLDLDPLPPAAAASLLDALTADAVPALGEGAARSILRASSGNPLAVALLAREWREHGDSLLEALARLDTHPVATLGIPRAIRTVFERQRHRLPPSVCSALDLAAVLGRRLATLDLYEAAGIAGADAAEALSRLRDEGVLREVQGALEFRNELIRAQAYYAVPAPARQHLHRRVGECLAGYTTGDPDAALALLLETAWHFLRGGDPVRGRDYGLRGAEGALVGGAPHEAEQMLEVLLQQHDLTATLRKRMRLMLAAAFVQQSKADRVGPLLETLQKEHALDAAESAEVERMRAHSDYLLPGRAEAQYPASAAHSLHVARASGDVTAICKALFEFARSGVETGDPGRLRQALDALQRIHADGGSEFNPWLLYSLGYCQYHSGDSVTAKGLVERAVELFRARRSQVELSLALTGLGACHQHLCQVDHAESTFREALSIAHRVGDDSRASLIFGNLASVASMRGDFDRVLECALESAELARHCPGQPFLHSAFGNIAASYLLRGDLERAEHAMNEGRDQVTKHGSWRGEMYFLIEFAGFTLMAFGPERSLDAIGNMEAKARGREELVVAEGFFEPLRTLRMAYCESNHAALARSEELISRFRNRIPIACYTMSVVRAWLETRIGGALSGVTRSEIDPARWPKLDGLRTLLTAQGFAPVGNSTAS